MKILALADRPPKESIKKLVEDNDIELICTLGDLDYFILRDLELVKDIPKMGVYGNHDSGTYFEPLGIINLHLKTFEYKGWFFGGFEGSLRYKPSGGIMYDQEEAIELLKDFPYVDVFLAHSPPYGINNDFSDPAHTGLIALRNYLETKKPKYFLHGHTYLQEGELITKFMKTEIIYVYGDKVIELR